MTSDYYAAGHTDYCLSRMEGDSRVHNIVRTITQRLKPGSKVLDIGCGDMHLRSLLPGLQYTGVDLDTSKAPEAVAHDLAKAPYPFPDATFDGVVCSEVLEHLWDPELALKEIARILRPGGVALITVPNFDSIDNRLTDHGALIYNKENVFSVEHIRQYTPDCMIGLLKRQGLHAQNLLGNSAYMSRFFNQPHEVLGKFLERNGFRVSHVEVDQLLGLMFPAICPGFLIEATKAL